MHGYSRSGLLIDRKLMAADNDPKPVAKLSLRLPREIYIVNRNFGSAVETDKSIFAP